MSSSSPSEPFALLPAVLAALSACGSAPTDLSTFRLQDPDSIVECRGSDCAPMAFYSDWQILGAQAFDRLQPGFRSMVEPRSPVDHPLLETWRRRLADLQSLAGEPDATASEIGWVGSGLPFEAAIDDAVILHVGADPARAARALDEGERLGISRAATFRILEVALESRDLEDSRVEAWMRSLIDRNIPAIVALARSESFGPRAATAGLLELESFSIHERFELFLLFARPLVNRPERADLLVDSLTALPRPQRGAAAVRLLASGSPQLHLVMAERLAELPEHERLELLTAIVRGPRFVGEIQEACVRAAQALPDPLSDLALAEIAASGRLEPAARDLLIR